MSGVRLEAKFHIVTRRDSAAQNIANASSAAAEVDERGTRAAASSFAALTEDERLGVFCLVDIGGATTDLPCFANERFRLRP